MVELEPQALLRERQIAAINARAANFTWAKTADLTWEFYDRLLALPPRQATPEGMVLDRGRDEAVVDVPHAKNWLERIARGYRIWRRYGKEALVAEYRQYMQWRGMPR